MAYFLHFFLASLLFLLLGYPQESLADPSLVTGKVYCDQCGDGLLDKIDYPLYGMEVSVSCVDASQKNQTVNDGIYTVWFDSKVKACIAYVSKQKKSMTCGQSVRSAFHYANFLNKTDGIETYLVNPLFSRPWKVPPICNKI